MHVINSVIVTMSKLTGAVKVYRGISGGKLPDEFWIKDAQHKARGGVEMAFLSFTLDEAVALDYIGDDKTKPRILFEVQMGMIDRGAQLTKLSQYSHEQEILVCAPTVMCAVRCVVSSPPHCAVRAALLT
jgi:hypothetical protein